MLFLLQNPTQIPSLEVFIIRYVCVFLKTIYFMTFMKLERKDNLSVRSHANYSQTFLQAHVLVIYYCWYIDSNTGLLQHS